MREPGLIVAAVLFATLFAASVSAQAPAGIPDATIDLATREGVAAIGGSWRTHETKIAEIGFRSVGADLKASGPSNRTYDFSPHAEGTTFDDSQWEAVDATTLAARRSTGKRCFNWYRLAITVPAKIGSFDPAGATLVFETVVDDYAEVWVDGVLERSLGQSGRERGSRLERAQPARDRPRRAAGPEDLTRDLRHQRADLGGA